MSQDILYQEYDPGEETTIVDFLKKNFKNWPSKEYKGSAQEYYKWKHLDSPYKKKTIILAKKDDKIVGCLHRDFRRLKIHDKYYFGYIGSDVAVDSDYRGQGLWSGMVKAGDNLERRDNPVFSFGFTVNPKVIESWKKLGQEFPHRVKQYIYINDVKAHQDHSNIGRLQGLGINVLKNIRTGYSTLEIPEDKGFQIKNIKHFDVDYDELLKKINDYSFIFDKNRDFLNWRYTDKRAGEYIVQAAMSDYGFLGFIVLKIDRKQDDYPRGYIIDLLAQMGREDVAEYLVYEALKIFNECDVNLVQSWVVSGHSYMRCLEKNGFIDVKNPWYIMYRNWKKGDIFTQFYNDHGSRINLVMGDTDIV